MLNLQLLPGWNAAPMSWWGKNATASSRGLLQRFDERRLDATARDVQPDLNYFSNSQMATHWGSVKCCFPVIHRRWLGVRTDSIVVEGTAGWSLRRAHNNRA